MLDRIVSLLCLLPMAGFGDTVSSNPSPANGSTIMVTPSQSVPGPESYFQNSAIPLPS